MNKIKAYLIGEIIFSNSSEAFTLYKKSIFGERIGEKIQYSLSEALYLIEKGQMELFQKTKNIPKKISSPN